MTWIQIHHALHQVTGAMAKKAHHLTEEDRKAWAKELRRLADELECV